MRTLEDTAIIAIEGYINEKMSIHECVARITDYYEDEVYVQEYEGEVNEHGYLTGFPQLGKFTKGKTVFLYSVEV